MQVKMISRWRGNKGEGCTMDFDIIDFHAHPFLQQNAFLCHYKETLPMEPETVLMDMSEAGIQTFCGSVICRGMDQDFDLIRKCNEDAIALGKRFGERYVPGIHVHPDYIGESVEELEKAARYGVKLVGELVPYMCGWSDYSCAGFSELLHEIGTRNMVVSVHTIDLKQMAHMAENHRNVQFVFAHPGEKSTVLEHVEIMKRLENVYLDLSGTGLFRYGLLRYLVNQVGAERILFGTDYPICNLQMYVGAVMGEKISARDKELVFSGNARRLLGL